VQTSLLGLGIAVILALVAALVAPFFVDWSQYRTVFEAQASRAIGTPVRITGAIDARLLPSPAMTLNGVEIGPEDKARATAQRLEVEFALGSLVRGEWRATRLRLVGPEIATGLDAGGKVAWKPQEFGFDAEATSIERLIVESGRVRLSDATRGEVVLDGLWFDGDVRSLLGPYKGEGGFHVDGQRFGYRLTLGRLGEDGELRMRLALDPVDQPLTLEADGALRFDDRTPSFAGNVTAARPAGIVRSDGTTLTGAPWRATARVKAKPDGALFEQLELTYGPEERAVRLTGTADLALGAQPRLNAILSARQADLDRVLTVADDAGQAPLATVPALVRQMVNTFQPSIPVQLGFGVDTLTFAGTSLQNFRGDLTVDARGWDLGTLEFRAPGVTQVRASGRFAVEDDEVRFRGPVSVESTEPRHVLNWLEARAQPRTEPIGPVRFSGNLQLGSDQIAVEDLRATVNRKAIDGRFLWVRGTAERKPRVEAMLRAPDLDIDGLLALARAAFPGVEVGSVGDVALAVETGRATVAGVEARDVAAKLRLDASGLVIDRLAVADLAGAAIGASGRIDAPWSAPKGALELSLDARSLDGVAAVLARTLPDIAEPVQELAPQLGPAVLNASIDVGAAQAGGSRVTGKVSGRAGAFRIDLAADATGDMQAPRAMAIVAKGRLDTADGPALLKLTALSGLMAAEKGHGSLQFTAEGALERGLRVDGRLTAGGLALSAKGEAQVDAAGIPKTALDVSLTAARAGLEQPGALPRVPVNLVSQLRTDGTTLQFNAIAGSVAGQRVRGKIDVSWPKGLRVEGALEADSVDLPALVAAASGMPRAQTGEAWSAQPFGEGLFSDTVGRVSIRAGRAVLIPGLEGRQFSAAVRFGSDEIALEDVQAVAAGGKVAAQLGLRRSNNEGIEARARLDLSGIDAATLAGSHARPPIGGRLGLQAELEATGRSPAAMAGALKGSGTFSLEQGQLAGLDPRGIEGVTRAVDQGVTVDAARIQSVVTSALDSGPLILPHAEGGFTIVAGQVRLGTLIAQGEGADLTLSGQVDLADWTVDARLKLTGTRDASASLAGSPDVFVGLRGPIGAPTRSVDVAALSGWLTLRAVEQQARRLEALEAERRNAPPPPTTTGTTPPMSAVPAPSGTETEKPPADHGSESRPEAGPRPAETEPAAAAKEPAAREPAREPAKESAPPPVRPALRASPPAAAEQAPPLPPPIDIRPPPGAMPARRSMPMPSGPASSIYVPEQAEPRAATVERPAPVQRSVLEPLFSSQN
jgi:uncharacterized protein involved in outer membrane biogenesis